MSWPDTLAAKIISGYIARKYDMDDITIRRFDPPMGAMPFFNNSASPDIREAELTLFGGQMLKFITELAVPLEDESSADKALSELVTEMAKEKSPSSQMVIAVDKHYRFRDEV